MRWLWMAMLVVGVGCRGEAPQRTAPAHQETPAQTASQALRDMQERMDARMVAADAAEIHAAAELYAAGDATTRVAVSVVTELSVQLQTDPRLQLDAALVQTAPGIAARMDHLRAALGAHTALLQTLHFLPLPAPLPPELNATPSPAFVDAAMRMEALMDGHWPLKRVFIAYALELEAVRADAEILSRCTEACPTGVSEQAMALQEGLSELLNALEAFAALHC